MADTTQDPDQEGIEMQAVETLNEGLKRAYTLTIARKDIDAIVDRELKKAAPRMRMPGFRPGKVPANLVRKMHGAAFEQDALNNSIQQSVQQLLADKKLRPAMQPSVELGGDFGPGQDAEVKVELEVLPDVPAPSIDGLKLERLIVPVTDEAVDEQVERLANQNKRFAPADEGHAAVDGDQLVIDFLGKVDGTPFEGGKGEGMAIVLGSGQLIPGFESALVGATAGEERVIDVTFPEDYGAKELAGKPATFDITVHEVKVAAEGAADDEFAKSLGLTGLDQLKELLKGQIEQEHNNLTRTHMKRKLLDQLADSHSFDVPPSMVDAEFTQIWAQLEHEASHEADPDAARADMEKERDDYRAIAERRVRLGLLLSEIGQANGIAVSDQEMNRLIAEASQRYAPEDRQRFAQYIQQEPMAAAQLRAPLYEDKVVDFLFGKAEISEREVTRADIEAAIEADLGEEGHVHGPGCGHDHDHDHAHDEAPEAAPAKKKATKKAAAEPEAVTESEAADATPSGEPAPAKPKKKAATRKAAEPEQAEAAADAAPEAEAAEKPKRKPAAKKAKPTEA
ncbi:trigger factor [Sphingomonas jejuensis]|uniref:Trigger factor n=2 Tax=Sphingomonas jejuensis TaxID=904715 RepID=A0ABX0XKE8_9SPHN|nr:trigger factor [Sphingomonas jejuensis]